MKKLREERVKFVSDSPAQELDKADSDDMYFIETMSADDLQEAIKAGEVFLEKTKKARADMYYRFKDFILSQDEQVKGLCPRSMSFTLDRVMGADHATTERMKYCLKKINEKKP